MKANLFQQLLLAHAERDESAFRKAALQLAASESKAGHIRVAEQIRRAIREMPATSIRSQRTTGQIVDIAQPRGELSGLLEGGHRNERLADIVLPISERSVLERLLEENRRRVELRAWGVEARRRFLLYGPPGCGKTLAASVIAGELGLPLMTVRLDGLFSRYLGETANQLKVIFEEMERRPAVYFFDEFDAIARFRGDSQDIGEVKRVVTSFLQLMDVDESPSVIVAATNYASVLDRAVVRRFDAMLAFNAPTRVELISLLRERFLTTQVSDSDIATAAASALGLSYADVTRAADDAIRSMVLSGRNSIGPGDLFESIGDAQRRAEYLDHVSEV